MKMVTAFIQPNKLNDVKQELYASEIFKISVSNCLGCGQQKGFQETYRGVAIEVNLLKKIRIDIAVNDNFVEPTIAAIIKGARTNNIGDGKIFVTTIDDAIRIRTGERGEAAIG